MCIVTKKQWKYTHLIHEVTDMYAFNTILLLLHQYTWRTFCAVIGYKSTH
uniref:Uncharacterized protein n=1 Tax=Anguilla anguilla TaxID=7936 RepID=A0A0E9VR31_ANGAN